MPRPLALFVGTWLPFSETFIFDQVRHQSRYRAHVFARRWTKHRDRFPYEPVHTLELRQELLYANGRSRAFDRPLRESGAELVHAHFGLNGVLALPFLRRRPVPLVVSFHGHDVGGLLPEHAGNLRYRRYRKHAPQMFDRASLLVCASQELADLLATVGAPEAKLRVHRLGVDVDRFAFVERPHRAPTVLMVGRLVEKKGMLFGLEAFARVHAERPETRLRIVGDGPLRKKLESRVAALGVTDAVELTGVLDAEGVRAALADADVLMAPSYVARRGDRESGLIVLKEAGATGLATIGTWHGGLPEIIDDEHTGFLVPERDVDALADRLRRLCEDHTLRDRMGRAAREKITREYDTVRQNEALEDLLSSAT